MKDGPLRVAILYPGDREAWQHADPKSSRFADLFRAFAEQGIRAEPAVYHDDFREEVRAQLLGMDGVLVWVNPLDGGRDRQVLDFLLRGVADDGVFVSTHPDVILKLGTKEVLYQTRELGWGCDTHVYRSLAQMRRELPLRLTAGKARVLKQHRGNGGTGVWRVELPARTTPEQRGRGMDVSPPQSTAVRVRHAQRGCVEEEITLMELFARCAPYFTAAGLMVDQEYQPRLPEGMIRCYLTHDQVTGFGHQAVNALFPAPPGAPPTAAPQPGPRYYYPPTQPEFQPLKHRLEEEWLPAVQRLLHIDAEALPILWDCDFLLGPPGPDGDDTYVLCEINVSSVAPYPESSVPYVVEATGARLLAARRRRAVAP